MQLSIPVRESVRQLEVRFSAPVDFRKFLPHFTTFGRQIDCRCWKYLSVVSDFRWVVAYGRLSQVQERTGTSDGMWFLFCACPNDSLIHSLIDCSIDWLIDWLVGWLIDWLIDWLMLALEMFSYHLVAPKEYGLLRRRNKLLPPRSRFTRQSPPTPTWPSWSWSAAETLNSSFRRTLTVSMSVPACPPTTWPNSTETSSWKNAKSVMRWCCETR